MAQLWLMWGKEKKTFQKIDIHYNEKLAYNFPALFPKLDGECDNNF